MLVFLLVLIGIVVVLYALVFFCAQKIYKSYFGHRFDDNHTLHYFTEKDFDGLKKEEFDFVNSDHLSLKGYIYSYDKEEYKGILVFVHGMGVGHIQYTTEINHFASLGYKVVTFDIRGTNLSSGKGIGNFSNPVYDLDALLKYIENNNLNKNMPTLIVGHSLGAYAAACITNFNHKIDGIVCMSPPNCGVKWIDETLSKISRIDREFHFPLWVIEKISLKGKKKFTVVDSLEKSEVKTLLVQGSDDPIVDANKNFNLYKEKLSKKGNVEFYLVEGRHHRPNLSIEANEYEANIQEQLMNLQREYKNKIPEDVSYNYYESLDYKKLTEMDEVVMEKIDDFLIGCYK